MDDILAHQTLQNYQSPTKIREEPPFWGYCTLADCKPTIRRTARVGDWVVGISPKAQGNKLVYAMQVAEILPYDRYYCHRRFAKKIPDYTKEKVVYKCGDNIYKPLPNGGFQQLQSMHSRGTNENPETKTRDLSGKNVLIAKTFCYFGRNAIDLSRELDDLKVGRGYKNKFSKEILLDFLKFIADQTAGVTAPPTTWPPYDDSWRMD